MTTEILILSANPSDTHRLRLDEEVREIDEGLRRSRDRHDFHLISQVAVRLRDLRRAMLQYEPQIVHFAGHGDESGIVLEDDGGNGILVTAEALAGLFELFREKVVCVLLNSCYSAAQAAAINNAIPYVIGMSDQIPDKAALEFSVGFYDALGAGRSIEDAFRFGRNAIQLYGIAEHLTPVLMKRAKRVLARERERAEDVSPDFAIESMLRFAQTHSQPGDWAGLSRLEAELSDLVWAASQAYELKRWQQVLSFRRALGDFLFWRGYWTEAIQLGERSFEAADRLNDQKERAWCALYPLARVHFHLGHYDSAESWSERSLELFRRQRDDYGIAAACRYLGRALQAKGKRDEAQALFAEGLQKARQFNLTAPQKNLQGHLLAALASVNVERDQHAAARRLYDEALTLYRETQDRPGIAEMLHRLGTIASQEARFAEAEKLLAASLDTMKDIHSEQMEAEVFVSAALLAERQGDLRLARERLLKALERFRHLSAAEDVVRTQSLLDRLPARDPLERT
jgi:tetratricopeptide (TPR) repeat protein